MRLVCMFKAICGASLLIPGGSKVKVSAVPEALVDHRIQGEGDTLEKNGSHSGTPLTQKIP